MYLLDTNICIAYLNERNSLINSNIRKNFELCDPDDIFLCSIVKAELFFGAYNSNKIEDNLIHYKKFFSRFSFWASLAFDDSCTEIYGQIVADLKRCGNRIGENDIMIASIAIANGLILVTNDNDFKKIIEYSRIKTLQYTNWTESPK